MYTAQVRQQPAESILCCMHLILTMLTLTTSMASEYWLANTKTVGAVGKVPSRKPNVAMSS